MRGSRLATVACDRIEIRGNDLVAAAQRTNITWWQFANVKCTPMSRLVGRHHVLGVDSYWESGIEDLRKIGQSIK